MINLFNLKDGLNMFTKFGVSNFYFRSFKLQQPLENEFYNHK